MFCSQIHEHREEHKKDGCFALRFMITVKNTKKIHEHREEHEKVLLECFALKFMSIVKNTKKIHEDREEHHEKDERNGGQIQRFKSS
ncbi:hypothetical protein DEO72_LG3g983 [Vigna unguiculata]|uniref:Uncharacterized protein n=1 Tax=Vigna unguiculata TaxID=3917 RepID=A0A4D6LD84_VIGUN|nr:hypothetical protein DEO72_LG3g983 [Vigna unguiculata]